MIQQLLEALAVERPRGWCRKVAPSFRLSRLLDDRFASLSQRFSLALGCEVTVSRTDTENTREAEWYLVLDGKLAEGDAHVLLPDSLVHRLAGLQSPTEQEQPSNECDAIISCLYTVLHAVSCDDLRDAARVQLTGVRRVSNEYEERFPHCFRLPFRIQIAGHGYPCGLCLGEETLGQIRADALHAALPRERFWFAESLSLSAFMRFDCRFESLLSLAMLQPGNRIPLDSRLSVRFAAGDEADEREIGMHGTLLRSEAMGELRLRLDVERIR